MQNNRDDREGRKPYRTYKAGRAKRSSVDDELAGARPARPRSKRESAGRPRGGEHVPDARRSSSRNADGERSPKGYRRYDSASAGGARNGKAAGKGGKPPGRRRRFRWWFIPVGLLVTLIVATVVVVVLAWPGYKKFDYAVTAANHRFDRLDKKTRAQLTPDNGWIWRKGTTVLLLGVDSKAGEPARSDTILLLHFDPSKRTVSQLSIPRDTRVDLPGRGYDKINAAMFWGGPSLAVKTVSKYLGIPINHVMVVNFQGFPRLVNAVGGVDMYVPKTISTEAGGKGRIVTFKKGMHHFDGKYGMLYVRIRHADDDFHRAARQQQFIQALQKKLVRPSNITKLPEIGKRFMSGTVTDLTTHQILELGYLKWRARGGTKAVMVGAPAWIGGIAYVLPPSSAEKQRLIRDFLK
jgi:polyisoprenyl-teichoic acid--peptidoglycan teichoic acid transferase